jgi:uncharacterized membrane protein YphA (DoxX/SURF4 family)/thiol-disulfide isomerase/thioredoxin
MTETLERAGSGHGPHELPRWKAWFCALAAFLLALTFLVSGVWKITDPMSAAVRMTQALVPAALSLPAALSFGISETFAAVLLLVPRLRRWGAGLAGLLLLAFMAYMGLFYNTLSGEECNCFPWIKRVVGPAFFIGDAILLLLALAAGWWARPSEGKRSAAVVLGAVCVFAAVSYGVSAARLNSVQAPQSIAVDGKPLALREGRVFLYFFNPECTHCDHAARELGKLAWGGTKVVGVPTQMPQFGPQFMTSTNLRGVLTSDAELLRKIFTFTDVPYGVALENGQLKAAVTVFDDKEPEEALRKLGFVK